MCSVINVFRFRVYTVYSSNTLVLLIYAFFLEISLEVTFYRRYFIKKICIDSPDSFSKRFKNPTTNDDKPVLLLSVYWLQRKKK